MFKDRLVHVMDELAESGLASDKEAAAVLMEAPPRLSGWDLDDLVDYISEVQNGI